MNYTLTIGQNIEGYRVMEYCKTYGLNNAESYKVVGPDGRPALMKIILDGCYSAEFTEEVCDLMKSRYAMPVLKDAGVITIDSLEYRYVVREIGRGTKLAEILESGVIYSWGDAVRIVSQVLDALEMLHLAGVIHNDITPENVIIDDFKATLIGFGHLSRACFGRARFTVKDLDPWYMAPETGRGRFDERSDLFSVGALLYRMVFGMEPWRAGSPEVLSVGDLRELRRKPLRDLSMKLGPEMDEHSLSVLCGMLEPDYEKRYGTATEVLCRLSATLVTEDEEDDDEEDDKEEVGADVADLQPDVESVGIVGQEDPSKPRGFAAIAGMDDVKALLTDEVLYVLENPEKVRRYRLKVPNGMLFFGPPGCGKTYIAENLAYESRLNFMMVKASDIGSTFVHGTQGKIRELFDKAAATAPTILCFDELDGMVPDRAKVTSEAIAGEVNEFLTQLNGCSERGIFVIGTTNRPEMIDPAILRSGRMDHLIYIPMPDREARRELFKIHLDGRPTEDDIDTDALARMTDGYVASDIELIVNKTALVSARDDVPISQRRLEERIGITRRSVSESERTAYESVCRDILSSPQTEERKRIGFKTS